MEAMSKAGPSDLQLGLGGLGEAPKVKGGFHDSSKRKDKRSGAEDHLRVDYEDRAWHVDRDGGHTVIGEQGGVERYPGEEEYAREQTCTKRTSYGDDGEEAGTFYTRDGNPE